MAWSEAGIVECRGVRIDVLHPAFSRSVVPSVYAGTYERNEAAALETMLEPGDRLLEVGGGCGFLSSLAGNLKRAEVIHTVEANPALIPLIERTHTLNDTAAEIHNELLGGEDRGMADFYVWPESFVASTAFPGGAKPIKVRQRSLAARLQEWKPSIIVMDAEGGELGLVRNPLPDFVRRLVLEVHPHIYQLKGVHFVMGALGRMGFAYEPAASAGTVIAYRRL